MAKTYTVDYFQDRKLKWEKNHGKFIHEFMFNEYQTRILGQCNTALNDLQRQLDLEIARAKAEEARIEAKAHSELGKIYNYINPSSSTYEDALKSQEPLKYNELAHVDGDFLAVNGEKDLNTAYNNSMAVLTQVINAIKEKSANNIIRKMIDSFKLNQTSYDELASDKLVPTYGYVVLGNDSDDDNLGVSQIEAPIDTFMDSFNDLINFLEAYLNSLKEYVENSIEHSNLSDKYKAMDISNEKVIYPYASWKVDTNELETTTPNTANKTLPNSLSDSYNAIAQAHHAVNNLYMVNNADSYTLNDQGRLIKNDQQTKLISNYNASLMNIAQAINRLAKKVEDLEQPNA